MKNYMNITAQPEYEIQFWNAMKNTSYQDKILDQGRVVANGTYELPYSANQTFDTAREKESVFRGIATVHRATGSGYRIFAKDSKDTAQYVPEGGQIPMGDGMGDFTEKTVDSYKLTSFIKMNTEFVQDSGFNIEKYLMQRFGKTIARGEDLSFVNGTGVDEPTGILHDTAGAEVGVNGAVTYDNVIKLYFSVDKEYRKNGVWMMNDATALTLRTLKDNSGNYLWNHTTETILGKPVVISNDMPDAAAGAKAIAFGDFSFYWIIDRRDATVRSLTEKFVTYDQIGYLAIEFLDAKLIRQEAIKVLKVE